MGLPATLSVSINFANGPGYGIPFTLDDPAKGILGTNIGSSVAHGNFIRKII